MNPKSPLERLHERRRFIQKAAFGTTLVALGGATYFLSESLTREAQAKTRKDGRPRLPPGQKVLGSLKPMGGEPGDPRLSTYRLRVYGRVERPLDLDFRQLSQLGAVEQEVDVHCVTGWSVLGAKFKGLALQALAERVGVLPSARYVIFEAAHGYTANVRREEVLAPQNMIVWELEGRRLPEAHGAPVRALLPDLYFWKSAKWLTAIRFSDRDEPGYWETRGYHNHADPWKEERYG